MRKAVFVLLDRGHALTSAGPSCAAEEWEVINAICDRLLPKLQRTCFYASLSNRADYFLVRETFRSYVLAERFSDKARGNEAGVSSERFITTSLERGYEPLVVFVSIHVNEGRGYGPEVWVSKDNKAASTPLADKIRTYLYEAYKDAGATAERRLEVIGDPKAARDPATVLSRWKYVEAAGGDAEAAEHYDRYVVGALVEIAFYDREEDLKIMRRPEFQEDAASAIERAIREFVRGRISQSAINQSATQGR